MPDANPYAPPGVVEPEESPSRATSPRRQRRAVAAWALAIAGALLGSFGGYMEGRSRAQYARLLEAMGERSGEGGVFGVVVDSTLIGLGFGLLGWAVPISLGWLFLAWRRRRRRSSRQAR